MPDQPQEKVEIPESVRVDAIAAAMKRFSPPVAAASVREAAANNRRRDIAQILDDAAPILTAPLVQELEEVRAELAEHTGEHQWVRLDRHLDLVGDFRSKAESAEQRLTEVRRSVEKLLGERLEAARIEKGHRDTVRLRHARADGRVQALEQIATELNDLFFAPLAASHSDSTTEPGAAERMDDRVHAARRGLPNPWPPVDVHAVDEAASEGFGAALDWLRSVQGAAEQIVASRIAYSLRLREDQLRDGSMGSVQTQTPNGIAREILDALADALPGTATSSVPEEGPKLAEPVAKALDDHIAKRRWRVGQIVRHRIGSEWKLIENRRSRGGEDDWRAECVTSHTDGPRLGEIRTFHREYMDRSFTAVAPDCAPQDVEGDKRKSIDYWLGFVGITEGTVEQGVEKLVGWYINQEALAEHDRALLEALTEVCPECHGDDSGGGIDEPAYSCDHCESRTRVPSRDSLLTKEQARARVQDAASQRQDFGFLVSLGPILDLAFSDQEPPKGGGES